jgi:hypothetical protein
MIKNRAGLSHMPWYTYKSSTRRYLKDINKDEKVLEYCLFHPGLFTDYSTPRPYISATHLQPLDTPFDFEHRRFLMREGSDEDTITFTTVQDLANIVARAIEFEGEWPIVGGIRGTQLSIRSILALGEEIRGKLSTF